MVGREPWHGSAGGAGQGAAEPMVADACPFQQGAFPFPVKYGYGNVGVVEQGPADLLGREVFCLYPHQTRYVVPSAAVTPLPTGLVAARAVLAANMETARGLGCRGSTRAADPRHRGRRRGRHDRLAVRTPPGAEVTLADIAPGRADLASLLGVTFAHPEALAGDADLVIHIAAAPRACGQPWSPAWRRASSRSTGMEDPRSPCRWARRSTVGNAHQPRWGMSPRPCGRVGLMRAGWPRRWNSP